MGFIVFSAIVITGHSVCGSEAAFTDALGRPPTAINWSRDLGRSIFGKATSSGRSRTTF